MNLPAPPLIELVTDRRRMPGDTEATRIDALVRRAVLAVSLGANLVQVREPDLEAARLMDLVAAMLEVVASAPAAVVVNDRADVALAAGAHGVHLPSAAAPTARVRGCCPRPAILGRSVHDLDGVARENREGAADYLLFGTVFPTRSKPATRRARGVDALGAACRQANMPLLAIGGVDETTVASVVTAGAAGFAAIGMFFDGRDREAAVRIGRAVAAARAGV
jgi:thiamine-phosphate pyrophosphorylase